MAELPITGIDHPVIALRNMTDGRAVYERLGFTVTPRGRHREWGTGNWCIMFERDYIELRGVIDPKNTHNLGHFLDDRGGLMGIAFGSDNAEASYSELVRRGLHPQPVRQLTRDFELPEGTVQPKFSLCFLDAADTPGLMSVVLCQHLTPELLRRPLWLRHANGALAVQSVSSVVPDLAEASDHYAKLFGTQSIDRQKNKTTIRVNARQTISLMTPEAALEYWPEFDLPAGGDTGSLISVSLEVSDISATHRYFMSNGIECDLAGMGVIRIAPGDSCEVPLEFTDRS